LGTGKKMRLFERDASRPGNVILQIGLLAYILATVACVISMNAGIRAAMMPMGSLITVPVYSVLIALLLIPLALVIFLIGTVSGVPYLSFSYCYSAAKRNWRGFAGAVLLISVVFAAASAVTEASR
jgi:hypothetical protein